MGTADHGGASSWTARYVTVLSQARWLVLASWALLSVLAAWQGPLFLSECVMRMPPETWTRSARGRAVVSAAFPEREGKEILALLLASNDGSAVTTPAVAEFTRRLSAVALDFAPRWVVFDLEHYYSYNEELPSIAEAFVTVFVRSMLVPAVMGVLNSWNWWPLELPAVSIREARLDFEE